MTRTKIYNEREYALLQGIQSETGLKAMTLGTSNKFCIPLILIY